MDAWFAITIKQRVPADKRSRHAICQTHPSGLFFLFLSFFASPDLGLSGLLIVAKYKARRILVCVWLFREQACFNVRVDGDGFNLGSSWRRHLPAGNGQLMCA